mmetsp:Transcript_3834/g.5964  ORF Transcript_3834/g.5964 Transcript_3834/m.5964 type:complete len:550 (+) Transcript_3834:128-1777(+)|eukprot:CAMPEP_0185038540 /NCGR_PEP_ID=MMETSP1103-20130426/34314_1 /TAXON_ID=36769 /ORGANISM="Paraphysomonas bandaiensis, Strain Caron Lab Isolate" /LENGTH=549 /DNA_ID=CAMNT_0027577013 /DNA_START=62 /DNA_END=1711 /DNA_ORIENTATION=-
MNKNIKICVYIGLLAVSLRIIYLYWVYIPALIEYIQYPINKNQPVTWKKPLQQENKIDPNKPNVVLILTDDIGYNDITRYGGGFYNGKIKTPNIDSIGLNGISFTNAYAGHATCAPSRAALLTGKYASNVGFEFTPASSTGSWILGSLMGNGKLHGIYHRKNAASLSTANMTVPSSEVMIPAALREHGYRSIHLGKWHLGFDEHSRPLSRGFDETLGFDIIARYLPFGDSRSVNCEFDDFFDRYLWANVRYEVSKDSGPHFAPQGYLSDYLAEEAANAITANKDMPFFMYLAFTSMHTPLQALQSDYEAVKTLDPNGDLSHCQRVYGAMLLALDRAVGTVLDALRDNGLTENTIVIFTNDNGGVGLMPDLNRPYRGWKATFFEGGVRVPMLVQWPQRVPKGVISDGVVSHIDIFPTIAHAAGAEVPNGIDGVSLLQHMQGNLSSDAHDELFWRSGHYMALRKGHWKLQVSSNPVKMWLYDLKADSTEQTNLAYSEGHRDKLQEMLTSLQAVNLAQHDPLWPSLSETPILIDKLFHDRYVDGDEYIYWPN